MVFSAVLSAGFSAAFSAVLSAAFPAAFSAGFSAVLSAAFPAAFSDSCTMSSVSVSDGSGMAISSSVTAEGSADTSSVSAAFCSSEALPSCADDTIVLSPMIGLSIFSYLIIHDPSRLVISVALTPAVSPTFKSGFRLEMKLRCSPPQTLKPKAESGCSSVTVNISVLFSRFSPRLSASSKAAASP